MPHGINAVRSARSSAGDGCIKTTRRVRSAARAFAGPTHAAAASETIAVHAATVRRDIHGHSNPSPPWMRSRL
jgi:hypothetical protein